MFPGVAHPSSPYIDVANERSRVEVHAAVVNYRQNGGLADFILMWDGFEVSGMILDFFLEHFRSFVGGDNPPNPHDAPSDATTETRSILPPSPSPPPPFAVPWDQSYSLLVSQPTISSRSNLPALLPRLTHTDSASFRAQDQGHGSAHTGRPFPNPNPNLDAGDENYQS
ncbi:hypothetical protein HD806DRAFT_478236 [Xylariaceae sp. AK1471]|nr:hypothetical protein HD806DRAFT_478236 [Xylariaceae sp. AK1471]